MRFLEPRFLGWASPGQPRVACGVHAAGVDGAVVCDSACGLRRGDCPFSTAGILAQLHAGLVTVDRAVLFLMLLDTAAGGAWHPRNYLLVPGIFWFITRLTENKMPWHGCRPKVK